MISKLREWIDELRDKARAQENELEEEREMLAKELKALNMQSVEDIKEAWRMEKRKMADELEQAAEKEVALQKDLDAAQTVAQRAVREAEEQRQQQREVEARVQALRLELEAQKQSHQDEMQGLNAEDKLAKDRLDHKLWRAHMQTEKGQDAQGATPGAASPAPSPTGAEKRAMDSMRNVLAKRASKPGAKRATAGEAAADAGSPPQPAAGRSA